MSGVFSIKTKSATGWLSLALVLLACSAAPVRADRKNEARDQFERAVRLRTILEGAPQRNHAAFNGFLFQLDRGCAYQNQFADFVVHFHDFV